MYRCHDLGQIAVLGGVGLGGQVRADSGSVVTGAGGQHAGDDGAVVAGDGAGLGGLAGRCHGQSR